MSILSSKSSLRRTLFGATPVLLILVGLMGCRRSLELGKVYDTWEACNDQFTVRITAFEEHSPFVGGGYFPYEAARRGTDHGQPIMAFRHDDPKTIPHDGVRLASDKVGYVFLGWKCAVTNDGSQTWSAWNAETDVPNWSCCSYGLIQDVDLSVQGSWQEDVASIVGRNEPTELLTEDYGKHWHR